MQLEIKIAFMFKNSHPHPRLSTHGSGVRSTHLATLFPLHVKLILGPPTVITLDKRKAEDDALEQVMAKIDSAINMPRW